MPRRRPILSMIGLAWAGLFLICGRCFAQPAEDRARVVHVFVALCDNASQGIQKVPALIGNGDDPGENLYWGCDHGVKTEFRRSGEWTLAQTWKTPDAPIILERCLFRHRSGKAWLVADAYRGRRIRDAIRDFFVAASGNRIEAVSSRIDGTTKTLQAGGGSDLVVYAGHDGLMEFSVPDPPAAASGRKREAIVLACLSRKYFAPQLRIAGAEPLLWTTDLMAPEAYTLKDALDGWLLGESAEAIRDRGARAYARNQNCSVAAARRLLVSGWDEAKTPGAR